MLVKRREFSIFTLSFLDIMSCGFGAVVLLFMISKHAATQLIETPTYDYGAEVSVLEQQLAAKQDEIAALRAKVAARGGELAAAADAAAAAREALAEEQRRQAPPKPGSVIDIEALRQAVKKLEADKRSLLSQPFEKSRYLRSIVGEGNREYLTGVQLGGKRILILLDTSTSMLVEKPVEALRLRNMDEARQRQSKKWQQALRIVDWIAAHFPQQSSFQIVGFDGQAHFALPGTDGQWLPVKDSARLDAAMEAMKQRVPKGGNSLERALMVIGEMNPPPDNVYLITDGMPTLGLEAAQNRNVSGLERNRLFERAMQRLSPNIAINTILLPLEGDPVAASAYWQLARMTQGAFLAPADDWP
ncbi:MAG: VWA domain-containing protein [Gammaproteobacteria bacterium]|nr:VWA domain-containing protein [Gammaproteobacteria bacterium]